MVDGLRHGEGRYTWATGAQYDGSFLNDKMHGKGKYTFVDGRVYEGDFVNDERHGQGSFASMATNTRASSAMAS